MGKNVSVLMDKNIFIRRNGRKDFDGYDYATVRGYNERAAGVPYKYGDDIFRKVHNDKILHALVKF